MRKSHLTGNIDTDLYCLLHFDEPLWSLDRIGIAILQFLWCLPRYPKYPLKIIGPWNWMKYTRRPYHQCMETGFCGGER